MTNQRSDTQRAIGAPIVRRLKLFPFYIIVVVFLGYSAWSLFQGYHDLQPNTLVAEGTTPERAGELLKAISPEQRKLLIAREQKHLRVEPLDRNSLVNLAVLLGLEGRNDESNAVALRAANRSLRDVAGQATAINISLGEKNYQDALMRIDAVLRAHPELSKNFFPIVFAAAGMKDATGFVTDILAKEPTWRADFMGFAAQQTDQTNIFYGLLTSMRDKKVDVRDAEIRSYLMRLIDRKQFETAYFVWLDFLSPNELRKTGLIFDGGFVFDPRNLFFDWNLLASSNVEISVLPRAGKANDRALRLDFANLKGPFFGTYQFLRLDSGVFDLSAEYMATALKTPVGMMWRITCAEDSSIIGQGPKISSSTPWVSYAMTFTVPAENCATQVLGLTWSSSAALDQVISGQIWFDEFKLKPNGQ